MEKEDYLIENMEITSIPQSKYRKDGLYSCCGPVCLEMVLTYFQNKKDAKEIFSIIKKIRKQTKEHSDERSNGWTYPEEHIKILKKFGLKVKEIKKHEFKQKIILYAHRREIPVIVNVTSFRPKSNKGHFVLVIDYQNGKIFFNDPENKGREPYKISKFLKHLITWDDNDDRCAIAISNINF